VAPIVTDTTTPQRQRQRQRCSALEKGTVHSGGTPARTGGSGPDPRCSAPRQAESQGAHRPFQARSEDWRVP
jgi:hypothetical protein